MKSFTDIEQSKKLEEILPPESADMWWLYIPSQGKHIATMHEEPDPHYLARMERYGIKDATIPCWSLAALIDVLPADWWDCNKHCFLEIHKQQDDKQDESSILYIVRYFYYKEEDLNSKNLDFSRITHISTIGDSLIDACVRMIIELHEHKLLSIK